jgi:hypothetical protein
MSLRHVKVGFSVLMLTWVFAAKSMGQNTYDNKHIKVALRMIEHQLLLQIEDSTSLVLPIKQDKNQYSISFESEFEFNPDKLVSMVNKVMKDSKLSEG